MLLLPLVWLWWGRFAAAGFAIGAATAVLSLWVASLVVRASIHERSSKVPAISKLQLALMAKLPIFAIVIFFTNSLGLVAIGGFLGGYVLVYFCLVLGAFVGRRAPTNASDD